MPAFLELRSSLSCLNSSFVGVQAWWLCDDVIMMSGLSKLEEASIHFSQVSVS